MKMLTVILISLLTASALAGDEDYELGPDSTRQEGVPQGTVTKDVWHSKIFPETVRDYWVYVPKQYDGTKPACVMVFQDGIVYVNETGDFRVPVVFDNLIHEKEMPVTIGIFINPGHKGGQQNQREDARLKPASLFLRGSHANPALFFCRVRVAIAVDTMITRN